MLVQQIGGRQLIDWPRDLALAQVQIREIQNRVPVFRRQEVAAGAQ